MILSVYDKGECVYGVQKFECQLLSTSETQLKSLLFVLLVVKVFSDHRICDLEGLIGIFLFIYFLPTLNYGV